MFKKIATGFALVSAGIAIGLGLGQVEQPDRIQLNIPVEQSVDFAEAWADIEFGSMSIKDNADWLLDRGADEKDVEKFVKQIEKGLEK